MVRYLVNDRSVPGFVVSSLPPFHPPPPPSDTLSPTPPFLSFTSSTGNVDASLGSARARARVREYARARVRARAFIYAHEPRPAAVTLL